ncbi:hypothetical protein ACLKA6_019141 [Drosophila palustris]
MCPSILNDVHLLVERFLYEFTPSPLVRDVIRIRRIPYNRKMQRDRHPQRTQAEKSLQDNGKVVACLIASSATRRTRLTCN